MAGIGEGRDRLPDFLCVGAAKSGTTSLYRQLVDSGRVFVPQVKEGRFFSQLPRNHRGGRAAQWVNGGARHIQEYTALFEGADGRLKGDISPDYFFHYERSIPEIKKVLGRNTPIIILLREPVRRAFSMYLHAVRLGSEDLSFERALDVEDERARRGYAWPFQYRRVGMSSDAVEAYLSVFENVKVVLFEDFVSGTGVAEVFDFLGVERSSGIDPVHENPAQVNLPRSLRLNRALHGKTISAFARTLEPMLPANIYQKLKNIRRSFAGVGREAELNIATEMALREFFRPDIDRLGGVLGRNLTHWANPQEPLARSESK